MIKISNLYKTFGNKVVLNNINLNIEKGSIFGLLGLNGAGKTTLISILNFLEDFNNGEILINNKNIKNNAKAIKKISAFVPQNFAFYPKLTAVENLKFFGALYGLKKTELNSQIQKVLELTSLQKEANNQSKNYSGGYKRRLNLAIALLNNPQILYLDEPTAGVDLKNKKSILKIIKNLQSSLNTTIIYTSHNMDEIDFLCDKIAILHEGKIILNEKKNDLLEKNENLELLFLNLTKEEL